MVIGAGTAGLAAAYTFLKQQDRLDITVLEAADKTGGRMGGDQVDGFYIDRAASLFMQSYATARSLAKEIGVLFKQSPHTKGGCLLQGGMNTDIYKLRREQLPDSAQGLFLASDYTHLPGTNGARCAAASMPPRTAFRCCSGGTPDDGKRTLWLRRCNCAATRPEQLSPEFFRL